MANDADDDAMMIAIESHGGSQCRRLGPIIRYGR